MSEEKRIDRLEGIVIDNQSRTATLEKTADRIERSIDKLLFEFSDLRSDFFKLEVRLTWKIITFSSLGGAVAAILMIIFGVGGK